MAEERERRCEKNFRRCARFPEERERGKKRMKKTLVQKLRKYEVRAEGYEFIPALMHVIRRYCHGSPNGTETPLDRHFAKALECIPDGRAILNEALKAHDQIPYEAKRRAFSPNYLNRPPDLGIDNKEMQGILTRGVDLVGFTVPVALDPRISIDIPGPAIHGPQQRCCCCCCCGAGTHPVPSGPTPSAGPPPNRYDVFFTRLHCVDESDPEVFMWVNQHDETFVVFGTVTEEMAERGTPPNMMATPVYEIDEGETKPDSGDQNLRLWGLAGPRAVDSSFLISATCMESDDGDVTETTNRIRGSLQAVIAPATSAAGASGWVVAGATILAIGITYLVDLFTGDSQVGNTSFLSLTQSQADSLTATADTHFFEPLHFDGGDDDGIYDAYLRLQRQPPA